MLLSIARVSYALQALRFVLCEQFSQILTLAEAPRVLAVDMPVGLLDAARQGGRDCDRAARRILGRGRQSSVFTPPVRRALAARSYLQAIRLNGEGMSRQAFGILAKIREVDQTLNPREQQIVYEAHPELAFARLAGAPLAHNKKTYRGREDRAHLLRAYYGRHYIVADALRARFGLAHVGIDDVLDAYALGCTAVRIVAGSAIRLPASRPPCDATGLRMEIWY